MKYINLLFQLSVVSCLAILISCGQEQEQKKEIKNVTTIDSILQEKVKEVLMNSMKPDKSDWGCAVLMETRTGEIKAMVNLSGDTSSDNFSDNFDFALLRQVKPGQMFSLVPLLSGFEDNYFTPDKIVETGKGTCKYSDVTMKDDKDGGWGNITVCKAFQVGSDIGISKVVYDAYNADPQALLNTIKKFSFNIPLGADSVEPAPYINSPEFNTWTNVSLPWLATGYECKMTPVQIMNIYNSVALEGWIIKPVTEKNDTIKLPIVNAANIYSKKTLDYAKRLLENTEEKSGSNTGSTVNHSGNNAIVINTEKNGSFTQISCAYFPAKRPEYTCIVVINKFNNPKINNAVAALDEIIELVSGKVSSKQQQ